MHKWIGACYEKPAGFIELVSPFQPTVPPQHGGRLTEVGGKVFSSHSVKQGEKSAHSHTFTASPDTNVWELSVKKRSLCPQRKTSFKQNTWLCDCVRSRIQISAI